MSIGVWRAERPSRAVESLNSVSQAWVGPPETPVDVLCGSPCFARAPMHRGRGAGLPVGKPAAGDPTRLDRARGCRCMVHGRSGLLTGMRCRRIWMAGMGARLTLRMMHGGEIPDGVLAPLISSWCTGLRYKKVGLAAFLLARSPLAAIL